MQANWAPPEMSQMNPNNPQQVDPMNESVSQANLVPIQDMNQQMMSQYIPPGYSLVPTSYIQQLQWSIQNMTTQISTLTSALQAQGVALQTLSQQKTVVPEPTKPTSLPDSLDSYKAIEAWIKERKAAKESKLKVSGEPYHKPKTDAGASTKAVNKKDEPCTFFKRGNCRMGSNCPYLHQKKPAKKWAKHPSAPADATVSTAEAISQTENVSLDAAMNSQEETEAAPSKATEVTVCNAVEEIQTS